MKREIDRKSVRLPDISGEIYEKNDHYWQDVTVRHDVTITYEDKKVRPKQFNKPLAYQYESFPPPYQQQYKLWADKWNLLISRKEWQEKELDEKTTSYDLGPIVPPTNAPNIKKGRPQFWYGCVNCWMMKVGSKYVFEDQIPKLVSVGCTGYHIEMFGWTGDQDINNMRTAYEKLVKLCRDNRMWLFVDIINGNWNGSSTKWTLGMGSHNHLTVGYIVDHYGQNMINIIKDNGPSNVIIQPIGEPGSKGQVSDCQRFQNMCCDQLGETFVLITEPGRSNSAKMSQHMKYQVEHVTNAVPQSLSENDRLIKGSNDQAGRWESVGSNIDIVVSDSGSAIQALASPETGSQQGWLNRWTSACSRASRLMGYIDAYKNNVAVVVYYHFKFKCMGTNGSTIDGELNKGTWDGIKGKVNPEYPT